MSSINGVHESAKAEERSEGHTNGQMRAQIAPTLPLVPYETTKMVLPADPGSTEAAAANIVLGKRQRKPTARATEQIEAANQARPRARPTPRSPRKVNKVAKRASPNNAAAKASPAPRSPAKKRASPRALKSTRATEPDYEQVMKDPVISPKDLAIAFPEATDSAARVSMLGQVREASGMTVQTGSELTVNLRAQQQRAKRLAKELATRKAYEAKLENDQVSEAAWILLSLRNSSPEAPSTPATSEATISNEQEVPPPHTSASCTRMPSPEEEPGRTHRRLDSVIDGRQLGDQDLVGSSSLPTERSTLYMR
ncbi:hypothetical protein AC579_7684 [Pseudocercospora musae]|uniref:Uncharacterized protein n=1 Tax=Pseudocercospora musae TaxID=113226 RepID=A0A139IBA4_9PEZI|nr:hypothetical protein AC579_7684 [Pseudocercospora musae]